MRIFTRFVAVCNFCFLLSVILRIIEMRNRAKGVFTGAIPFKPLESSIVVLGYTAIIINIIFCLVYIIAVARGRQQRFPRMAAIFNLLILPAQVYYFFFSTF